MPACSGMLTDRNNVPHAGGHLWESMSYLRCCVISIVLCLLGAWFVGDLWIKRWRLYSRRQSDRRLRAERPSIPSTDNWRSTATHVAVGPARWSDVNAE